MDVIQYVLCMRLYRSRSYFKKKIIILILIEKKSKIYLNNHFHVLFINFQLSILKKNSSLPRWKCDLQDYM